MFLHTKGFVIKILAVTYFHMGNPTLSSAQSVFTTEFEMESGGSHLLLPPGNWLQQINVAKSLVKITIINYSIKPFKVA
tara:strand:+ start:99 stop:335 length:237 start_codon:yes stop_codon:yes gene_type:complete